MVRYEAEDAGRATAEVTGCTTNQTPDTKLLQRGRRRKDKATRGKIWLKVVEVGGYPSEVDDGKLYATI
jgi:hypothetical protein